MKMERWSKFADACKEMQYTKGNVLSIAYNKDWRGIDSAIPQYMIGKEICASDIFWKATDCTGISYRVIDLRDIITDIIADMVIKCAGLRKHIINYEKENGYKLPEDGSVAEFTALHATLYDMAHY